MSTESRSDRGTPARPRARNDVVFRELADEWVLFDPVRQQLHVLNLTAAVVWAHCTGEREVGEIVEEVAGAFETPPPAETVAREVEEVLRTFGREGLLSESDEASP